MATVAQQRVLFNTSELWLKRVKMVRVKMVNCMLCIFDWNLETNSQGAVCT